MTEKRKAVIGEMNIIASELDDETLEKLAAVLTGFKLALSSVKENDKHKQAQAERKEA